MLEFCQSHMLSQTHKFCGGKEGKTKTSILKNSQGLQLFGVRAFSGFVLEIPKSWDFLWIFRENQAFSAKDDSRFSAFLHTNAIANRGILNIFYCFSYAYLDTPKNKNNNKVYQICLNLVFDRNEILFPKMGKKHR